jgi:hypothetical protein
MTSRQRRLRPTRSQPGPRIPPAGESWRGREVNTYELRVAFGKSVTEAEAEDQSWVLASGMAPSPALEAKRRAIRRAGRAHGLLKIRMWRIPLPKRLLRRAMIS